MGSDGGHVRSKMDKAEMDSSGGRTIGLASLKAFVLRQGVTLQAMALRTKISGPSGIHIFLTSPVRVTTLARSLIL